MPSGGADQQHSRRFSSLWTRRFILSLLVRILYTVAPGVDLDCSASRPDNWSPYASPLLALSRRNLLTGASTFLPRKPSFCEY